MREQYPKASLTKKTLALLFGMLFPIVATAEPAGDFEDLFRQGNLHAQAGRLPQALIAYKQAYQARPEPVILVAMGLVDLQLGRFQDALKACQKYLAVEKSPASREKQATACVAAAKDGLKQSAAKKNPSPTEAPQRVNSPAIPVTSIVPAEPQVMAQPEAVKTVSLRRPEEFPAPALLEVPMEPSTPPAPASPRRVAIHKKWWFWTIIGVVAAGAAVGLGVGLANASSPPAAPVDPLEGIPPENRREFKF